MSKSGSRMLWTLLISPQEDHLLSPAPSASRSRYDMLQPGTLLLCTLALLLWSRPPQILRCFWSSLWWYSIVNIIVLLPFVFMVYWQIKYLFKKCTNVYSTTVHSTIITLSVSWLTCSVVSSCGQLGIFKESTSHHQQDQWPRLHTKAAAQYSLASTCIFTVARDVVGCNSQGCGLTIWIVEEPERLKCTVLLCDDVPVTLAITT